MRIVIASILVLSLLKTVVAQPIVPPRKVVDKQRAVDKLSVAQFEQLHQKLTKMSTERVWSIPWQLSVRKARELAAAEEKPVFLWISSNGGTHPLGPC